MLLTILSLYEIRNGKENNVLRWDAIRVVDKYLRDAIHVDKGFRDEIRVQRNYYLLIHW